MKLKAIEHSWYDVEIDENGNCNFAGDEYTDYMLEVVDAGNAMPLGGSSDVRDIAKILEMDVDELKRLAGKNNCFLKTTRDYVHISSDFQNRIDDLIKDLEPWEMAARMRFGG